MEQNPRILRTLDRPILKTLASGAAIAAVSGLLMGLAVKPNLNADDRPEGPQLLAGWAGARATGPFDDGAALASYQGQMPDYVLGTDWKKALTPPADLAPAREERYAAYRAPPPEPLGFADAAFDDPPPAQPRYPSVDGPPASAPEDTAGDAAG